MGERQLVAPVGATAVRSALLRSGASGLALAARVAGRPAGPERRGQTARTDVGLHHMMSARALQPQLVVGAAGDPFEREAEQTADRVMGSSQGQSAGLGVGSIAASLMRAVQRAVAKGEPPKRKDEEERKQVQKAPARSDGAEGGPVPAAVESRITTMTAGGQPLESSTRAFFEPRFGFDFGGVRTHTGGDAAGAAGSLGARAFTVGDHIYFGAGEYQPQNPGGLRLLAHELTHTIQQKPAAARAARMLAAPVRVQRDLIDDAKSTALAKIRQWADALPPYELLTVLLGKDPITDKQVDRSPRNFLHAALRLVPDGMAIFADLEKNKSIEKVSEWFSGAIAKLNLTWEGIKGLFRQAWDSLGYTDFLSPSAAWEKVKAIFGPTLGRIADFAIEVGGKILGFIKKAVLDKLGAWAKQQKGYTLLTFVLGKDPVTDEAVDRTPKTFVKAVLDLVPGGDKIFENLEKAKTIEKTVAWLNDQITKLDLTWEKIKELFRKAWNAFAVSDFLNPLGLIDKLAGIFVPPATRVITFALAVGKKVLEFIFEGVMIIAGPIGLQIVGIAHKIGDAFNKIVEDPVAFVGNLVKAVKLGFQQFGKNIWEHLKEGLIGWLVGTLSGAGLVLPKVWNLKGIVSLVLQILGITYAKIRAKLVVVVGDKNMARLEAVFGFIKTLVTEGPAAAWEQIVESIGSLWDMVIGGIKDWAVTKIVTAAITKIASLLNPAGAVFQAILAIYNTVAFFIERIKQILALVEAVVDSIANIAAGKLAAAANFVEKSMARTIPVILGFLARLIGLGNVSEAVKKVITDIQAKVDKAIDAVIKWVVAKAKALFGTGKDGKPEEDPKAGVIDDSDLPKADFAEDDESHTVAIRKQGGALVGFVSSTPTSIEEFIASAKKSPGISEKAKAKHLPKADGAAAKIRSLTAALSKPPVKDRAGIRKSLAEAENELASALKSLLADVDLEKFDERYKLEGLVATYGSMPKQSGDRLTPDHQPQAALLKHVASVKYKGQLIFGNSRIQGVVTGHATGAVAINLHEDRHKKGSTYGKSVPSAVVGQINDLAASGASPATKKAILAVVEKQKKVDVEAMLSVAKQVDSSYADIELLANKKKKKAKPLIDKLKGQIVAGEAKVMSQDLQSLGHDL